MAGEFSERARQEAERYGADPWIFVRELLQNARDAGARSVTLTTGGWNERAWLSCRDDGEGMTFEHAQQFLFRLYASSKEGKSDEAGRFGVGFWSILRFEPSRIVVRSWPRAGSKPWQVALEGDLSQARWETPPSSDTPGTEILLERDDRIGALAQVISDTARQTGRFLTLKEDPGRPLKVTVNGVTINAPFELPAPSSSFQRGRLRGVVGLGSAPRVELFSKGLRVRSAATLEDLLSPAGRTAGFARLHFPPLADGLAPQALLECGDLEVLLSRRDARDTPALRRLVRLAQRELERLIEQQLAFSHAQPWWRRTFDRLRYDVSSSVMAILLLGLLTLTGEIAWILRHADGSPLPVAVAQGQDAPRAYRDLADSYAGPQTNVQTLPPAPPEIRYSPPEVPLHLAIFQVASLDSQGRPFLGETGQPQPYQSSPCSTNCVELEVLVSDGPGTLRLPVPTGHRVDAESVRLAGQPVELLASSLDEPFLRLSGRTQATLRYRTHVAASPDAHSVTLGERAPSPLIDEQARSLRRLPPEERVARALEFVRGAVAYSTAQEVADAFRTATDRGEGFLERSLRIRAGDCDVQNGVLLLLLQKAGIPSRMAVGHIGREGTVHPWMHAWVEYDVGDRHWRVVDASERAVRSRTEEPSTVVVREPAQPRRAVQELPVMPGHTLTEPTPSYASDDTRPALADRPPPTAETPTQEAPVPAAPRPPWGLLAILGALGAGGAFASRRVRRSTQLDPGHDVSKLLRGVLENPAAFRHVPSLQFRRILPRMPGGALSLAEAYALAARGRLYSSQEGTVLALGAARQGSVVLDRRRPEGATVARALGAVDLDTWDTLLRRCSVPPLLQAVNGILRRRGEGWRVYTARSVPGASMTLALSRREWLIERELRSVVLDEQVPWLLQASELASLRPRKALLLAVDRLAELLSLPRDERSRLLAPLAVDALREEASP